MPIERQYPEAPSAVYDALVASIKSTGRLGKTDPIGREVAFAARAGAWDLPWRLRVAASGSGSIAGVTMKNSGSDARELFERKKIQAILDGADRLLAKDRVPVGILTAVKELPAGAVAAAIAAGFPVKHQRSVEPILVALDEAEQQAAAGEVLAEELAIREAFRLAASAGLFASRPTRWVHDQVQQRTTAGTLRLGVELLGRVGEDLTIMSDRVLQGDLVQLLDNRVRASVEVGGQVLQSTRPTLTRMAIGSVLPGSALLVGLAMPKTTTTDLRTGTFILAHPQWRITEPIDPDAAQEVAGLAAQLNLMFAEQRGPARPAVASPNLADDLRKLGELRDSGVLTEDEFIAAKSRLLR